MTGTSAPACERSSLHPAVRLVIAFAALIALTYGLSALGVPPTPALLAILVAATCFAWRFWWNCGTDHRGPLLLVGTLWVAGIARLVLDRVR